MPLYAFQCKSCDHQFDRMLKLKDYDNPQDCPACGASGAKRRITGVRFNLPGDGWASKNGRLSAHMRKKNDRLTRKQDEKLRDQPGVRLAPNVDGVRTGTWKEAQALAASKGKDAKTYESKVRREKAGYK